MNVLKPYIKCLVDRQDVTIGYTRELTKDEDFARAVWCWADLERRSGAAHYLREFRLRCFRSRLHSAENDDITFRSELGIALSRGSSASTTKADIYRCQEVMKKEVL